MVDVSRRDALRAVGSAGALLLAGCSGRASDSIEVPRDRGEPVPDHEVRFVRDTDGGSIFARVDESAAGRGTLEYLTSAAERDALTFSATPPADELRAFVDATDLESASVYLLERPVGACYEVALVSVIRRPDSVDANFCQKLRPADVDCSADVEDTVGVAIRLPFAGDEFNGLGSGWSSDCDRRPVVADEGGGEG